MVLVDGETNDHLAPFAWFASGRDRAAVSFHNTTADREADARSFVLIFPVQALEWGKDAVHVLFFEPDAVVFHLDAAELTAVGFPGISGRFDSATDPDFRWHVRLMELEGVRNQILK